MSFYLLPAASYQTQQKLKEQMEGKKKDLQKRKKSTSSSSSKHRSSKAPSISAPSTNTFRTPRSSVSSSGNDSFLAPSARNTSIIPSDSRSSRASRASHDITHKKGSVSSSLYNDSIYDEYANTSSSSSSTMSSIHSSRKSSTSSSSFNYSSNADMHQVLKVSKQHALKKKVDVADSMAKMSLDSAGYSSDNKDIKVQFKSVNFQGGDAETSHSAASTPQMDAPKPAYSIVEQDDSSSDSEEPNNLNRVYSNVSSIFSTKKSSLYKSPSASTSIVSSPLGNAAESDHIDLGHKPANKFARFKKKFST